MKKAIIFSGQGAQYPGMVKELYDNFDSAKEVFKIADKSLNRHITELCFDGSKEDLDATQNTQPCMLAADLAAANVLREKGFVADAVAGFSLGEYAALVYAGVISINDVFKIIQIRADAMQDAVRPGKGAMVAMIGVTCEDVKKLCKRVEKEYIEISNYNSPIQTVVSGTAKGIEMLMLEAEKESIMAVKLPVSAPFHCKLMEPAAERLEKAFCNYKFRNANIPVYMNVDGKKHTNSFKERLVKQVSNPVRWTETLDNMHLSGVDTFIECGPGKTLSGFVKKTLKDVTICRVENLKTLENTINILKL